MWRKPGFQVTHARRLRERPKGRFRLKVLSRMTWAALVSLYETVMVREETAERDRERADPTRRECRGAGRCTTSAAEKLTSVLL